MGRDERMTSVGVPTETKSDERRVALTPEGAAELVAHGVRVLVQQDAGLGSSIQNDEYRWCLQSLTEVLKTARDFSRKARAQRRSRCV